MIASTFLSLVYSAWSLEIKRTTATKSISPPFIILSLLFPLI
jgi:hypothetical protein